MFAISKIINKELTDNYIAITMPENISGKEVIVQARSGAEVHICQSDSDSDPYYTLCAPYSFPWDFASEGKTLFYAKVDTAMTETLEIMIRK